MTEHRIKLSPDDVEAKLMSEVGEEQARWLIAEARWWAIWCWQLGDGAGQPPPWQFEDECQWVAS